MVLVMADDYSTTGTGYPGKRRVGVGGVSLERAKYEAGLASSEAMTEHELAADPHPQYAKDSDLLSLGAPKFVTLWKWS